MRKVNQPSRYAPSEPFKHLGRFLKGSTKANVAYLAGIEECFKHLQVMGVNIDVRRKLADRLTLRARERRECGL